MRVPKFEVKVLEDCVSEPTDDLPLAVMLMEEEAFDVVRIGNRGYTLLLPIRIVLRRLQEIASISFQIHYRIVFGLLC